MNNETQIYNTSPLNSREGLNIDELNTRIVHANQMNRDLCNQLCNQIVITNLRHGEEKVFRRVEEETANINLVIEGMLESNKKEDAMVSGSSRKRQNAVVVEEDNGDVCLLTPSKWMYETPDKQKYRKMEELDLNYTNGEIEPCVLGTDTNTKTIYEFNEFAKRTTRPIDVLFETQEIDINMEFLEPICNVQVDPNETNQFLTTNTENIMSLDQFTLTHTQDLYNSNLNWYEKHMRTLATCRPVKQMQSKTYKSLVHRRCLSFDEDNSISNTSRCKRFKSFDDHSFSTSMEEDMSILSESEFYAGDQH